MIHTLSYVPVLGGSEMYVVNGASSSEPSHKVMVFVHFLLIIQFPVNGFKLLLQPKLIMMGFLDGLLANTSAAITHTIASKAHQTKNGTVH